MAKKYLKIRDKADGDVWMIDGNIQDSIIYLQDILNEYGENACLDIWIDEGMYGGGNSVVVDINYVRDETDRERNKRLKDAAKSRDRVKADKIKNEENERAELARLQKKYS